MAEVLDRFEFVGRDRLTKYPWPDWFDGRVWQIERHKDFDVSAESMRQMIHIYSIRRGVKVKTSVRDDIVVFQAIGQREKRRKDGNMK